MIKIVNTDAQGATNAELTLFDDNDKPTRLLVGLVLLELTLDVLVAYGAYSLFKRVKP